MPTQFGVFRPGPKAPNVEGLCFAGKTLRFYFATMRGAADSAMICVKEILGEDSF